MQRVAVVEVGGCNKAEHHMRSSHSATWEDTALQQLALVSLNQMGGCLVGKVLFWMLYITTRRSVRTMHIAYAQSLPNPNCGGLPRHWLTVSFWPTVL